MLCLHPQVGWLLSKLLPCELIYTKATIQAKKNTERKEEFVKSAQK